MSKFLVKVEGKLIVDAADKKLAQDRANVYMGDKGLPGFKATEYGTEQVEDSNILTPV